MKTKVESAPKSAPKSIQAAPPVEKPSAKQRKQELQKAAAETRALLGDFSTARKKGGKSLSYKAAEMLVSALSGVEVSTWPLKGGGEAIQSKGLVGPIAISALGDPSAKGRAIALNQALAPFVGYQLRVVAFSGKKGVSIAAFLALAGK